MEFARVSHKMIHFRNFRLCIKQNFGFFPIYLSHVQVCSQAANADQGINISLDGKGVEGEGGKGMKIRHALIL
jgi:hypothetical protein